MADKEPTTGGAIFFCALYLSMWRCNNSIGSAIRKFLELDIYCSLKLVWLVPANHEQTLHCIIRVTAL